MNASELRLKAGNKNTLIGDLHPASGDAHRRTVLLLHGGGQTRHSWRSTAQHLADRGWNAISLDLRGHGDSAWSESGDYHFDDFANDLTAVAKHVADEFGTKPVVIGASLGGISVMLAEGEAEKSIVSAVVLVDVDTAHAARRRGQDTWFHARTCGRWLCDPGRGSRCHFGLFAQQATPKGSVRSCEEFTPWR